MSKLIHQPKRKVYFQVMLLLFILVLGACGPRKTDLSFETIEQSEYSAYVNHEPSVVLITALEDANRLKGLISEASLNDLISLDFTQYFAVAVFRGVQSSTGYDTFIERVMMQGDQIVIYAHFWDRTQNYTVSQMVTSPYHLIKIRKDVNVTPNTELILESQSVIPTPLP